MTKKANISHTWYVLFLFYRFYKSGVTNELKSLFLLKSKKVTVIYSKQDKMFLLVKR